jgi:hypothetical protein
MIISKSQIVYWKGCNVIVYEKDNKENEQTRKLIDIRDGQGIIPLSIELYITDGKVKDE